MYEIHERKKTNKKTKSYVNVGVSFSCQKNIFETFIKRFLNTLKNHRHPSPLILFIYLNVSTNIEVSKNLFLFISSHFLLNKIRGDKSISVPSLHFNFYQTIKIYKF